MAGDGSVFIAGGFSSVDGVARSGLVKLSPDGFLDATFTGTLLNDPGDGWLGFQENLSAQDSLFALPGGQLMQLGQNSWTLHNADGSPNVALLAEFPRSSRAAPRPQFITSERVIIIGGTPKAIHAYQAADLSPDGTFQMEAGPRPVWQTVPAVGGKLWVLGRTPPTIQGTWPPANATFSLFRLEASGAVDPTFATRDLPVDFGYSLMTAENGGFRLTREWLNGYLYSPRSTSRSLESERFDAAGELVATVNYALPFSWESREVVFQAPDLRIYPDFNVTRLLRSQPSSQLPDPAFRILLAAPESPVVGPVQVRTLDEFPDGKLLVGGTRRMLADGSPDATWHVPRLERNATVSKLTKLSDGSLLAVGDFDRANGQAVAGVVRLLADDTRDSGFSPAFDFRFAKKVREFPDGSLLALFSVPALDSLGRQSQLVRFSSAGAFVSLWPVPDPPGSATLSYGQVTDFAIQSDGTTLVTTFQNIEIPTVGFRRIEPDGSSPLAPGSFANSSVGGALLVLSDDSYLRGNVRFAADGTLIGPLAGISEANPATQLPDGSVIFLSISGNSRPQKWHPTTGADSGFVESGLGKPSILAVTAAAHDKMCTLSYSGFARLHPTGQIDPTFRPPVVSPHDFIADGNGSMLIAGSFEMIDVEPRSGIARLADNRVVGFEDWMAAAAARSDLPAGSLTASADADSDGSSNWLEYAAGTDPVGGPAAQPRPVSAATWRLPCNPEAPEISRRLETSDNLIDWHVARGDEVRVESNYACLTWSLLPGAGSLFTRVRVE